MEEIKELQLKERECVPNLRGACPVGREEGGHLYAAQLVGRGGLDPQRRRRGVCGHGQPRGGGAIAIN